MQLFDMFSGGSTPRRPERSATVSAATVLTAGAPTASAGPCTGGTGSLGSSASSGSSPGGTNPIPWLNGSDGGLPNLKGRSQAVAHLTGLDELNDSVRRFNVVGTDLGIMWDNARAKSSQHPATPSASPRNPFVKACWGTAEQRPFPVDRPQPCRRHDDRQRSARRRPARQGDHSEQEDRRRRDDHDSYSGVEANGIQYINFMSVRNWGEPGEWVTNFGVGVVGRQRRKVEGRSDDGSTERSADRERQLSDGRVSSKTAALFIVGTPSGRKGSVPLARVKEADFANQIAYEILGRPRLDADRACRCNPGDCGPVGEMSIAYNDHLRKTIALYSDGSNPAVMRVADRPEGPWGARMC